MWFIAQIIQRDRQTLNWCMGMNLKLYLSKKKTFQTTIYTYICMYIHISIGASVQKLLQNEKITFIKIQEKNSLKSYLKNLDKSLKISLWELLKNSL